ncbi:hypothetical protein F5Y16DRAFT_408604 [Xylariaceae sp. FL0255]|nr:hypothetical protein F5Y16DRAFT_408604 [Xylariaceae sp. FL0255]
MPSFPRIGKHSNRSQHNLIEQQQDQERQGALRQLHLQQQQELQASSSGVGSGGGGGGGGGPAAGLGGGGGGVGGVGALPLSQPPQPPQLQQQQLQHQQPPPSSLQHSQSQLKSQQSQPPPLLTSDPPRRVSAAGVGADPSTILNSASPGPAPSLSSNDSFHRPQVEARPSPLPSSSQPPQQTGSPLHSKANSLHHQQQQQRSANSPIVPPPPGGQQQPIIPLNSQSNPGASNINININSNNTAAAAAYTNTLRQQQSQLPPQPRDNFAELVSRSQSARLSQVITPLQTHSSPYGSADDLSQTISPIVGASPQPPPNSNTDSASKRSARRLIRNFLGSASSSSSRPTSDHYASQAQEPLYENPLPPGVARRGSKQSSNTPRAAPLLARSIDHPDWVPPPVSNPTPRIISQQQVLQQQQPLPPPSSSQPSPNQGVGEFDSFRSVQDPHPQDPDDTIPPTTTIRRVPSDSDETEDLDLAFHQQQAIALHQAKLLQQRGGHPLPQPPAQPRASPDIQQQFNHPVTALPNPETVSQLSHESPTSDSEQATNNLQPAQDSPAVSQPPPPHEVQQRPTSASSQGMAPPPTQQQSGGPGQGRRSVEKDNLRSVEPPPGPPPGYRHSQANPLNSMTPLPPTPGAPGQAPPNYRPGERQQQYDGASADDRGRNSPQPSTEGREVDHEKQFKDLLTKYKNVKRLYFDGKAHIEQMNSQVEQLQNALANQRLSQSRTALDDSEYSTRFNRLNGAINNLSFNIRKDWEHLPSWIERFVTPDAMKTGKQEMTAVGRAVVSRWIIEEVFNKCFHPALDVDLSYNLKQVEQNIRKNSYTMSSQEEYDALTTKVVAWRMTTLEGLQHLLNSPDSADHRADYTKMVTSNLTATLYQYLSDPPPAGVDGSASMIVELAIGIATNLPLESRDVALTYPMPGEPLQLHVMEPEKQALPPLPEPVEDFDDNASRDGDKAAKREKTKSGMLNMLGGAPHAASSRKGSTASLLTDSSTLQAAPTASTPTPPKDASRVRFAGFIGVEVRGRQVLMKAPVWTMG